MPTTPCVDPTSRLGRLRARHEAKLQAIADIITTYAAYEQESEYGGGEDTGIRFAVTRLRAAGIPDVTIRAGLRLRADIAAAQARAQAARDARFAAFRGQGARR